HRLLGVQYRLLRQVADLDAGHGNGFAFNLAIDARHDAKQGGLAGTVQAQHPDLGAGEEGEGNIAQDLPLRGHDLAHSIHRENVLSHIQEIFQGRQTMPDCRPPSPLKWNIASWSYE